MSRQLAHLKPALPIPSLFYFKRLDSIFIQHRNWPLEFAAYPEVEGSVYLHCNRCTIDSQNLGVA